MHAQVKLQQLEHRAGLLGLEFDELTTGFRLSDGKHADSVRRFGSLEEAEDYLEDREVMAGQEYYSADAATILDEDVRDRPASVVLAELREHCKPNPEDGWYATPEQALVEDLLLVDEDWEAPEYMRFGDITGSLRVKEDEDGEFWYLFDVDENYGTPATVDGLAYLENWFDFANCLEEQD